MESTSGPATIVNDSSREEGHTPSETAPLLQKRARDVTGKIVSTNVSLLVAGLNDAALGVLIPYIQPTYGVTLFQLSQIYLVNCAGCLAASFSNIHVCSLIGTGGTLVLGAVIQTCGFALMYWHPPFALFVAAFFFTGMGGAYQDAQANTFTTTVDNAHRWLGILHAVYGVGTIISPIVANVIASRTPVWHDFYFVMMGLGLLNFCLLRWTFREGLFKPNNRNASGTAGSELKATLSNKAVWILSGFFFLYVGAEVTVGGWMVQFIVSVRNGDPKQVGYIASGFWAGFTLGRVALADITHYFGERRMVFVYLTLAVIMQLLFWLVPNIIVIAIAVFLLGFVIGPFYPIGLYVLTQVVPDNLRIGALGLAASLGQAGAAAFPFMTGAIASRAGVQVMQPIMLGLLIGIGLFWASLPRQGAISI
ncbi:major facilitator superfamily domain-containing protein [Aspergillus pseudotamarii]|uniref:Major facilitator superfamily domain-containing protein n=1 Tax=Aspergillus pseudotamarii TaxID=132259 RepID=A0A5N6T6G7_ASPPS|nr:major facilitator superfamily domain-containing protein [Aspergillus pseudotamarii]KAE8141928.1 major facilitator superfamily domain-containing protein [Aspergillus pseudotamarii]